MKFIDNIADTVKTDLQETITPKSKLAIAAASFSIYAYKELKKELDKIEELRFIFTSPTFTAPPPQAQSREFYIPRQTRERELYGSEFEVRLRNEMSQQAVAKECAEWIKRKVCFKSNITTLNMAEFIHVKGEQEYVYTPVRSFTTADLGCTRGNALCNPIMRIPAPNSRNFLSIFDDMWADTNRMQDVTERVVESISQAYRENSPEFIYYVTLYNIFSEFLEDISSDVLPNEATGFKESKIWKMLYEFQKDAAQAIINKLEHYNGCILADSVGLGKTFSALAVIKYYENRNKSVLVLCPKKLAHNWNTYKDNYVNNPIADDRLRFDVLFHTDLSRKKGFSNGLDLSRLNWSNYDLIVIDESHNFRNGGRLNANNEAGGNRYTNLLNRVIRKGVKTKVLMLSATPVNNRFNDLKNQLQLAYEGDSTKLDAKLNTERSVDDIFRNAQKAFNLWSKLPPAQRTEKALLQALDFDFFELLDSVTIARSRKQISRYYNMAEVGGFPDRKVPLSIRPQLTDLNSAIGYNEIFGQLILLNLSIYTPSHYIHSSKREKYAELYDEHRVNSSLNQSNREIGIRRLMAINLMKRLESSVYSFRLTLERMHTYIGETLAVIEDFSRNRSASLEVREMSDDTDEDENIDDLFRIGKKVKIDLNDMDHESWKRSLVADCEIMELLLLMVADITPRHDGKLCKLLEMIEQKMLHPINPNNRKLIIFTAFADTATYLYEHVSRFAKEKFALETAMVTGSVDGKTTLPNLKPDLNNILTLFSPHSKRLDLLYPGCTDKIDVLIATDCISEGQNLQDCDYLINFDIHWNPVRIIQRFGRIDRIGSTNKVIQMVNFWPDITLDEYINLKSKVETKMKIVDMAAAGDENLLSEDEKMDLEYRKQQLLRLQEEVVDLEDMSNGISIMDLGLNEFRLDLLDYYEKHPGLREAPLGMHAVTKSTPENIAGVIYILRNRTEQINISKRNRLHPFYLVYVSRQGEIVMNQLESKDILDRMRELCKGRFVPLRELCDDFNKQTADGKHMENFSCLLGKSIASIVDAEEQDNVDAFLSGNNMSFVTNKIKGLDDFDLISFLVIQ